LRVQPTIIQVSMRHFQKHKRCTLLAFQQRQLSNLSYHYKIDELLWCTSLVISCKFDCVIFLLIHISTEKYWFTNFISNFLFLYRGNQQRIRQHKVVVPTQSTCAILYLRQIYPENISHKMSPCMQSSYICFSWALIILANSCNHLKNNNGYINISYESNKLIIIGCKT